MTITTCTVNGCKTTSKVKNMCEKHYMRNRRYGSPFILKRNKYAKCIKCGDPHMARKLCKKHYQMFMYHNSPKYNMMSKLANKKWSQKNPRSHTISTSGDTIELQIAMNNVRKRDNNKCKWANCDKDNFNSSIHVHHIYPRSEYPELSLYEPYMICYCKEHHSEWHKCRGDACYGLIGGVQS